MLGIVSLLDPDHRQKVEDLWAELDLQPGQGSSASSPLPHFSYHVASAYPLAQVAQALESIAETTQSFTVRASGLGLFTGQKPVLHIPLVRTTGLSELHQRIWHGVADLAQKSMAYYHPRSWQPHITLALGDPQAIPLSRAWQELAGRELTWEIRVQNLGILTDEGGQRGIFQANLNPSGTTVRSSPVHGKGVFAVQGFQAGETVLVIDDSRTVDPEHPLREALGEHESHCDYLAGGRTVLMQLPERYINSSCDPNTYVKTIGGRRHVVARYAIRPGDEITYDYIINCHGGDEWRCHCGSPRCRGTIVSSFFELPEAVQREYLPLLDDWFVAEHPEPMRCLRNRLSSR